MRILRFKQVRRACVKLPLMLQGFWLVSMRMGTSIQEQQKLHHSQIRRMKQQQNDLLDKVEGLQSAVCRGSVSDKT